MPRRLDLSKSKFSRLQPISIHSKETKPYKVFWNCVCDCGNSALVTAHNLLTGDTQSCGCLYSERGRKGRGVAGFNDLYRQYKWSAGQRGLAFELTQGQFRTLTSGVCAYCGAVPSQLKIPTANRTKEASEWATYTYNGIDRKDNRAGYYVDNCVSCCGVCNLMKLHLPVEDFVKKCKTIAAVFS